MTQNWYVLYCCCCDLTAHAQPMRFLMCAIQLACQILGELFYRYESELSTVVEQDRKMREAMVSSYTSANIGDTIEEDPITLQQFLHFQVC